jgi:hypothetical protein
VLFLRRPNSTVRALKRFHSRYTLCRNGGTSDSIVGG